MRTNSRSPAQARLRELRAAMKTDGKGDERQGDRRGQRG